MDEHLKYMNINFTTRNILGMNQKIMMSKNLKKKYKNQLVEMYKKVIIYMKNTKRFNQSK